MSTRVALAFVLAREGGDGGTPLISRKLVWSSWAPRVCTSFPGLTCSALLRNPCQGPRQMAQGSTFTKVLSVATFYSKYTRALSFENMSTGLLAPGRKSARQRKRRLRATRQGTTAPVRGQIATARKHSRKGRNAMHHGLSPGTKIAQFRLASRRTRRKPTSSWVRASRARASRARLTPPAALLEAQSRMVCGLALPPSPPSPAAVTAI